MFVPIMSVVICLHMYHITFLMNRTIIETLVFGSSSFVGCMSFNCKVSLDAQ